MAGFFVIASSIPLVALAWLGHGVLTQQADIDRTRSERQLQNSAALLGREIDRRLSDWEAVAVRAASDGGAPPGTAVIVLGAAGLADVGGIRLPFYPIPAGPILAAFTELRDAQHAEFEEKNYRLAADLYARATSSLSSQVQAAAMLGLSRCLQRAGRRADALAALERLEMLGRIEVAGAPAALVAHRQRLDLAAPTADREAAARERAWLTAALSEGRLPVDRPTYEEFATTLRLSPSPDATALALAEAAAGFSPEWRRRPEGRMGGVTNGHAVAAVWRQQGIHTVVVIGPFDALVADLQSVAADLHVGLQLESADGDVLWGDHAGDGPQSSLMLRDAGLPWSLRVNSRPQPVSPSLSRLRLFAFGFAVVVLMVAGASYTMFRFMRKGLAVAQLQREFVAAVSHEFRTPLTAISHFTEVLEEGTATPPQQKEYFAVIGRESRRLRGLVENLLDFGRLEDGRGVGEPEEVDAAELAKDVVRDFRSAGPALTHDIRVTAAEGDPFININVDRHAIGLALRNLIENAIKYSPGAEAVEVSVTPAAGHVEIAVRDYGVGVARAEQRLVFQKFVRGSSARALMVKGTGIGLAMADRIIRAHGGSISLRSVVGGGSTFTISLPRAHA